MYKWQHRLPPTLVDCCELQRFYTHHTGKYFINFKSAVMYDISRTNVLCKVHVFIKKFEGWKKKKRHASSINPLKYLHMSASPRNWQCDLAFKWGSLDNICGQRVHLHLQQCLMLTRALAMTHSVKILEPRQGAHVQRGFLTASYDYASCTQHSYWNDMQMWKVQNLEQLAEDLKL